MKCIYAWTQVYIDRTGKVSPCCSPIEFGHLDKNSISEAFTSTKANELRHVLTHGPAKNIPECCRDCLNLKRTIAGFNLSPLDEKRILESNNSRHADALENFNNIKDSFEKGTTLPAGAGPLTIMVELGFHCNIRCFMCPQDHSDPRKISPEHVDKIKQALPTCQSLAFTGGEPLVYKEYWELVDYFPEHAPPGAVISTLTNAQLLTLERLEKHFAAVDLAMFSVNIDACTKETYEKIRVGASWDTLMRNIQDLQEFTAKHGKNWGLGFGFTIMKSNLAELKGAIKLAGRLGAGFCIGPITGHYFPVKNCRTFFEENIFRFSHLGYTKEYIEEQLRGAFDAIQHLPEKHRPSMEITIRGMIDYLRKIERIDIPADKADQMRALDDDSLSQEILAYYTRFPAARKNLAKASQHLKKDHLEEAVDAVDKVLSEEKAAAIHPEARALKQQIVEKVKPVHVERAKQSLEKARSLTAKGELTLAMKEVDAALRWCSIGGEQFLTEAENLRSKIWPKFCRIRDNYAGRWSRLAVRLSLVSAALLAIAFWFVVSMKPLLSLWLGGVGFFAAWGALECVKKKSHLTHNGRFHYATLGIGGGIVIVGTLILHLTGMGGWIAWSVGILLGIAVLLCSEFILARLCPARKVEPKD